MGDIGAIFACPMIPAACVIPYANLVTAARPDKVDIIIILIGSGASVMHVKFDPLHDFLHEQLLSRWENLVKNFRQEFPDGHQFFFPSGIGGCFDKA